MRSLRFIEDGLCLDCMGIRGVVVPVVLGIVAVVVLVMTVVRAALRVA